MVIIGHVLSGYNTLWINIHIRVEELIFRISQLCEIKVKKNMAVVVEHLLMCMLPWKVAHCNGKRSVLEAAVHMMTCDRHKIKPPIL